MTLRLLSVIFCLLFIGHTALAQVRPGIKFGLSTPDVDPGDILVTDPSGTAYYRIFVENARYGVHAGAFIQMQIGGFFIQPEILYNSSSVDYRIDDLLTPGEGDKVIRDSYRSIDFPVLLGLKVGPVRLGGGPVGHILLETDSGFNDYPNFNALFDDLAWGWQAGVGLDLWKLHIDVRYEGNFSKLGDYITFYGRQFDFATNNNRMIASLGFSF
jgi:hypothetical protein